MVMKGGRKSRRKKGSDPGRKETACSIEGGKARSAFHSGKGRSSSSITQKKPLAEKPYH